MDAQCLICDSPTSRIGSKTGSWRPIEYELVRCSSCNFSFVTNPSVDYENVYSDAYYAGQGADPLVNYATEMERPQETVRQLEWRGIENVVGAVTAVGPATRWLDYGCGSGGLVRYLRSRGVRAEGYDHSAILPKVRSQGVPVLELHELESREETYDVVTAIEVVEHLVEPKETFERISRLLKPGGIAFFTTGNAERFRSDLLKWQYFIPEIHVALYEPRSLEAALKRAGLQPEYVGWKSGYSDVISFKILKGLKKNRMRAAYEILPRTPVPFLVDRKFGVSAFPIGVKPKAST